MLKIGAKDSKNNRWKKKDNNKIHIKKQRGDGYVSESVRTKLFCCAFKLGFLQLICQASSLFKSNLELTL